MLREVAVADDGQAALKAYHAMRDALNDADLDRFGRILADDSSQPIIIGTGSREYMRGREAILGMLDEQFRSSPGLRFDTGEIDQGLDGNVCWIADRTTVTLPDGSRINVRHTAMMRRVDASWRLVSSHLSVPDDAA